MHAPRFAGALTLLFGTALGACGSDDEAKPAAAAPTTTPSATTPRSTSLEAILRRAVQGE